MPPRPILLLGNPILYQVSAPVVREELPSLASDLVNLRDTLLSFRETWGVGRAIAAPQIGLMKRIVFLERVSNDTLENRTGIPTPTPLINPQLTRLSAETVELWDDCMSFPELFVRVRRHASCDITYRDLDWRQQRVHLTDDLSELLQHECDHLDGILAIARAVDGQSFALRSQREQIR
jgi:peptide deformylase